MGKSVRSSSDRSPNAVRHRAARQQRKLAAKHLADLCLAGRRLGQYKLIERIGGGGLAQTYEAQARDKSTRVALKVVPIIDVMPRERVEGGATVLRRYTERGVTGVVKYYYHGFVTSGDLSLGFLSMQLIRGSNLSFFYDRCRRLRKAQRRPARFTVAEALSIFRRICIGHASAAQSILPGEYPLPWGDGTFANVMFSRSGRIKLTDFDIPGLMLDPGRRAALSEEGNMVGTPHYFAPEVIRGITQQNEQSDIFALGIFLFKLLTGQFPFHARSIEGILEFHVAKPFPRFGFPSVVRSFAESMVEKDPCNRPQSSAEVLREVNAVLRRPDIGLVDLKGFYAEVMGDAVAPMK